MAISEAEAVIMEVLWRQAPRSAEDILAEVGAQQDWQEGTVKSLLNRLLTKKAVKAERDGRRYLYWPQLTREQGAARSPVRGSRSTPGRAFLRTAQADQKRHRRTSQAAEGA
jgi:predicted transcriptional regulator